VNRYRTDVLPSAGKATPKNKKGGKKLKLNKKRTEAEWRAYFDRLSNEGLVRLGRLWGMNSLANYAHHEHPANIVPRWCTHNTKQTRIELLLIHLEISGKIKPENTDCSVVSIRCPHCRGNFFRHEKELKKL
tara:strand:- start:1235 stop:1630 length:396 start_codon:yes stop_codon:yes gene_type:complete